MSEHDEQVGLFQWVDQIGIKKHPDLIDLHAIPNGGHRSPAAAGKLKAEGVRPGVWDLSLPVPVLCRRADKLWGHYHGLIVEMKFGNNKLDPDQSAYGERMWEKGYYCGVCYSWPEAVNLLEKYLDDTGSLPAFEVDKYSRKNWRDKLVCGF